MVNQSLRSCAIILLFCQLISIESWILINVGWTRRTQAAVPTSGETDVGSWDDRESVSLICPMLVANLRAAPYFMETAINVFGDLGEPNKVQDWVSICKRYPNP